MITRWIAYDLFTYTFPRELRQENQTKIVNKDKAIY